MTTTDDVTILDHQADSTRDALASRLAELRRRASARYVLGQSVSNALPVAGLAAKALVPAVGRLAARHPGAMALATAGAALATFGEREDYSVVKHRAKQMVGDMVAGSERALRNGLGSIAAKAIAGKDALVRAGSSLGLESTNEPAMALCSANNGNSGAAQRGKAPYATPDRAPSTSVAAAVAFALALGAGLLLSPKR